MGINFNELPRFASVLTRHTDVAAASVKLLTKAGAALLLGGCINMDVIRLVLHVLGQHCNAGAVILLGSIDASFGPVRPEDVLFVDSHGERVLDSSHDHLSVLTS